MDDNARPHRASKLLRNILRSWFGATQEPARSSETDGASLGLSGRQVAILSPPRSLGELEQSLLHIWSLLPISCINNLIDSMEI
ncbi:hypothetical protein TNCV_367641 [Trichonephila clavipes]|nr:hypothetical protein TNCV_367641 [Trichonephila clavipes]